MLTTIKHLIDAIVALAMKLLVKTETSLAEFWSSTLFIVWGVGLVDPWPESPASPVGLILAKLGSADAEAALGAVILCAGVSQSIANLVQHRTARRVAAFAVVIIFVFLGVLSLMVAPGTLFARTCLVGALVQALVYLRLSLRLPLASPPGGTGA